MDDSIFHVTKLTGIKPGECVSASGARRLLRVGRGENK